MTKALILLVVSTFTSHAAQVPAPDALYALEISETSETTQDTKEEVNQAVWPSFEAQVTPGDPVLCSCIAYARKISPYQPPKMRTAKDLVVNSATPSIGAWMKLNEGRLSHVEVVIDISPDGQWIRTDGANFVACQRIRRVLKRDDPSILGYYVESTK